LELITGTASIFSHRWVDAELRVFFWLSHEIAKTKWPRIPMMALTMMEIDQTIACPFLTVFVSSFWDCSQVFGGWEVQDVQAEPGSRGPC